METTWQKNWAPSKVYPPLERDAQFEVVIVGGGITGVTLAYLLAKSGKKVAVLEAGTLEKSSYTAYTTAFLTYEIDTDLQDLEDIFGRKSARDVWQSGVEAIEKVEKIIDEEKIDCEFVRCPMYLYANDSKEWDIVHEEAKRGQAHGFDIYLETDDKRAIFKDQAKFHPLKYVDGLRQAAVKHGAEFFENTKVTEIKEGQEKNQKAEIVLKNHKVTADWVAVCTYKPFNNPPRVFARKGMYVSYIYELAIKAGVFPEALYLDAYNPYHYFRIDEGKGPSGRDRMIIGGEDHRKEIKIDEDKNFKALLKYAERVLGDQPYEIVTRWTGGILETIDGLPYIGEYSKKYPNVLLATGFSGNGMTYSMIAAHILRDTILGKVNPYHYLYTPLRSYSWTAARIKGRDYVGEMFGGVLKNLFRR